MFHLSDGWNESHFTLYARIQKSLGIVFKRYPQLRKQYEPYLVHTPAWEDSLAGMLALHVLAARELYSNGTGFGRPGRNGVSLEEANASVYRILLNHDPIFDTVSPGVRRLWNPFHSLYARLRDLDSLQDPAIKEKLRIARKLALVRKKALRAQKAREQEARPKPKQLRLFHH